ncbi:hypothetical protein J421_6172 (plasmid) [Gemmatirosa kalamazoonensis]|uniref:Uncharacterized protein n=1 Tax=Gemmatirosa kalamazoonensis TaxID=861299 RepID=W0RTE2_9BACT|nr:hypothetical protein [Gemmatirosa kalamazoonensis]AHG93707.1 hypothetical protein J421_6172 [Gemmatirosa kalamazoonensis]
MGARHGARWGAVCGAALAATAAGCAALRGPEVPTPRSAARNTEANVESRWHVAFVPSGAARRAEMGGWASMRSGESRANTSILLNITNATPGAVHPWQLHHGRCDADRGIYGPASAYEPIVVDADGRGAGQATVRMPLPAQGPFFVRIAASGAAPDSIVACGDLVPPAP